MSKSVRIDFYVLLGIIFLSVPIILYFQVRPLTSALFFFVIPTIYLFFRKKKPIKEVFLGSLLIGNGIGLIFNIITSANGAWAEISSQLVFDYRIFGFMPVDEPIWFFFAALFATVFYEHFYEKDRSDKLSKRFKYIAIPTLLGVLAVITIAIIDKNKLIFDHAYFYSFLPLIIPIGYVVKKHPSVLLKIIKTGAFFFMLFLIYELTAVKLGQWYFPGQYIGWIELFGLRFPFEELLFWMGLSSSSALSIYEGFVDDGK
mgnify:CR=1 FL=1